MEGKGLKYPIGIQDFWSLRTGGYVYVDKTGYIPHLMEEGKYLFLGRPRRFGKSLFLSTLEYFFEGRRELFGGLSVNNHNWGWEKYPVIHIDLNGADYTIKDSLTERLAFTLSEYEKKFATENEGWNNLSERFRSLISHLYEKTGCQVVVLVDEYEKPILDTLENKTLSESHRDMLRGFYGVLKSMDKFLKLVFLTGVTKFGQMNIFSGLNNVRDISLNPLFGAICGITPEELRTDFRQGIEDIAKEEGLDFEESLQLLKDNYDGYHFCRDCPDIFNPYSLMNAFADKEINAYWSHTGTPQLLAFILKKKNRDLDKLEGITVDKERLLGINNQFDDPVTLFYQTGYLTIKSYDKEKKVFTLGYPNREVEQAFFKYLLPNFSGMNVVETESFMDNLRKFLERGEAENAMKILEEFSAGISYDVVPNVEVERHFQDMLYIITRLLLGRKDFVKIEEKTSDGRIDLLISTADYLYILEIKRDSNPKKALNQIREKEYPLQYRSDCRKVYLIGVNFSTKKKRIDGFVVEPYT